MMFSASRIVKPLKGDRKPRLSGIASAPLPILMEISILQAESNCKRKCAQIKPLHFVNNTVIFQGYSTLGNYFLTGNQGMAYCCELNSGVSAFPELVAG
jgi:hypothetical protein